MDTEEHIFRLSSIDQAAKRGYVRYGLCFSCASHDSDMDSTTKRITSTVKRTITHLPILAGRVRPASSPEEGQRRCFEVAVTLENVKKFAPEIKHLTHEEFPHVYENLERAGMPPSTFINDNLTPLPNIPDPLESPVFAVQLNFVVGGLIVALNLHRSVADEVGLGTVISHLSSDLPSCKLTNDALEDEATEQSRLRDRLSGSRGVKADMDANTDPNIEAPSAEPTPKDKSPRSDHAACRVLSFNLKLIEDVKDLINERFHYIHNDQAVQLSSFDALAAILWKGVSRAHFQGNESNEADDLDSPSSLIIPLDVRKTIEPQLDDSFFGNATVSAIASSAVIRLIMPFVSFSPGTHLRDIATPIHADFTAGAWSLGTYRTVDTH